MFMFGDLLVTQRKPWCVSGPGPLWADVMRRWMERFPGPQLRRWPLPLSSCFVAVPLRRKCVSDLMTPIGCVITTVIVTITN